MNLPKVTFGIINCNRLHYLKSCVESLIYCTDDYTNKEIIIVDNASVEDGTEEYLKEKEECGLKIFRQKERDTNNEFAKALNLICEEATGDFIAPLQGDVQFIVKGGWLQKYVEFYSEYGSAIGCMTFDAQRNERIINSQPFGLFKQDHVNDEFRLYVDPKRHPILGAADCMYSRQIVDKIYPWHVKNKSHEGGEDSETAMLTKVQELMNSGGLPRQLFSIVPQIPVSVGIYTDARGTNARVRGNRRYGDYWPPKESFMYYHIHDYDNIVEKANDNKGFPLSIEVMATPIGWKPPVDNQGNWIKNPIRPETATRTDYVELVKGQAPEEKEHTDPDYLSGWMED